MKLLSRFKKGERCIGVGERESTDERLKQGSEAAEAT